MLRGVVGPWAAAFAEHERFLFGLCYRMTGVAAEAEDLVQETFARALERPPRDREAPLRPWLVRVALNLARDALRARRRRGYVGPWLPSPVAIAEEPEVASAEARYEIMESATFAFLLALEALTASQRAVLLLRDVFDYSVAETSAALELSEANVKTTLHRARAKMERYDRERRPPDAAVRAETEAALVRFFGLLASGDLEAIEATLAADVRSLSDGGGIVRAATRPVTGAKAVAALFAGLMKKSPPPTWFAFGALNGLPALLFQAAPAHPRLASRLVLTAETDAAGALRRLYVVAAPSKLTAVRFGGDVG